MLSFSNFFLAVCEGNQSDEDLLKGVELNQFVSDSEELQQVWCEIQKDDSEL